MTSIQHAHWWVPTEHDAAEPDPAGPTPLTEAPEGVRDARVEMDDLLAQVQAFVAVGRPGDARANVDSALDAVTRLQVVTANLDASKPINDDRVSRALVAFADRHLTGHADAIERGMTYTSDNTMRLLRAE